MAINDRETEVPRTFQNDLLNLRNKDEVITALIHLGYLGYDAEYKEAYMPNYEVATAFESAMATDKIKKHTCKN